MECCPLFSIASSASLIKLELQVEYCTLYEEVRGEVR